MIPAGFPHLAGGVGGGHGSPQALGAVDDDDARVGGLLQLAQQIRAIVGGVPAAVRLQDDALHGGLQESPHLHGRDTECCHYFWLLPGVHTEM